MSDEESRVIDAAVAFVETELCQTDYEELKGSNSLSIPVEYMDLIEAVRDMQLAIKKTSLGDGEGQVCQ